MMRLKRPALQCMCPHCGEVFSGMPALIKTHDWPRPCRQICPGSGQVPRDPNDRRPLWKDEKEKK